MKFNKRTYQQIIFIAVCSVLLMVSLLFQSSRWFTSVLLSPGEEITGQYILDWKAEEGGQDSIKMKDSFWVYMESDGTDIIGEAYWSEDEVTAIVTGHQRGKNVRFEPFTVYLPVEDSDGYAYSMSLTLELRNGDIQSSGDIEGDIKVTINNDIVRGNFTMKRNDALNGLYALNSVVKNSTGEVSFVPLFVDLVQQNDILSGEVYNGSFSPQPITGSMTSERVFELTVSSIDLTFNTTTNSLKLVGSTQGSDRIKGSIELISADDMYHGSFTGQRYGNEDTDNDGITDREEIIPGNDGYITDPKNRDTDRDGFPDKDEIENGYRPDMYDGPKLIRDVSNTHPSYKDVITLVRDNILTLQNGNFYPDRKITYAEVYKMSLKIFTSENLQGATWEDTIAFAESYNLIPADGVQDVWAPMPRDGIVHVLNTLINLPDLANGSSPFTDIATSNYIGAIVAAYDQGLIQGYTQSTFAPRGTMTRAAFVSLAMKYKKALDNNELQYTATYPTDEYSDTYDGEYDETYDPYSDPYYDPYADEEYFDPFAPEYY